MDNTVKCNTEVSADKIADRMIRGARFREVIKRFDPTTEEMTPYTPEMSAEASLFDLYVFQTYDGMSREKFDTMPEGFRIEAMAGYVKHLKLARAEQFSDTYQPSSCVRGYSAPETVAGARKAKEDADAYEASKKAWWVAWALIGASVVLWLAAKWLGVK